MEQQRDDNIVLKAGYNPVYKYLARKTRTRDCLVSDKPVSRLVVDFRSRLFRHMRLTYANRTFHDRVRSVSAAVKELQETGDIATEKRAVFFAALVKTKREVASMQVPSCTYVFPSPGKCRYKGGRESMLRYKQLKLEELKKRIGDYMKDVFDMESLKRCALCMESYIMSDLDDISTMYSGKEWTLGIGKYAVPGSTDSFESDRLCARLAREGCSAILSEDFDVLMLFGADLMVKEVYNKFFVYVSLKDAVTTFKPAGSPYYGPEDRKDAVHRCCIMGTDYNIGIKGIGPAKIKKIDENTAKELFEKCLSVQLVSPKSLYGFFMLDV
jgi:hypothetical protein